MAYGIAYVYNPNHSVFCESFEFSLLLGSVLNVWQVDVFKCIQNTLFNWPDLHWVTMSGLYLYRVVAAFTLLYGIRFMIRIVHKLCCLYDFHWSQLIKYVSYCINVIVQYYFYNSNNTAKNYKCKLQYCWLYFYR